MRSRPKDRRRARSGGAEFAENPTSPLRGGGKARFHPNSCGSQNESAFREGIRTAEIALHPKFASPQISTSPQGGGSQQEATLRTLLIRHCEHALQDHVLVGRLPGVHLTTRGREHAREIGRSLAREGIALVQCSPRERCVETAEEIAAAAGAAAEIQPALDEIDFGAWTGAKCASLQSDPVWNAWNALRALTRPPGGESMREAQERIVNHVHASTKYRLAGRIAMITHAEIIRAALLYARGLPLDAWNTIPVAPGEIVPVALAFQDAAA